MFLYHLTALPPGSVRYVAYGSFSAPRKQEIVLASGSSLQLFSLSKAGQLESIARANAFANVSAIAPFRLVGSRQDFLLVTSDSGALALLTFSPATRTFSRVQCEVFGKSGCRRAVPGQFLAADPKGRACMVGALERSKFAYILTRDASELITIRSPLEAHKSGVATHALVALDVGFSNPMFAAIERPYEEADAPKLLVYYELDLGLNHVVRKFASPVEPGSYVLLPVPGGTDGPGGVLVCSHGRISYRNLIEEQEVVDTADGDAASSAARIDARMPYRKNSGQDCLPIVVCGTFHRLKDVFFFMMCTDQGDLLKVELDWSEAEGAIELRIVYFDSLPAPAHALAIFRSGYLFAALETGDPMFLKFNVTTRSSDDTAGGAVVARKSGGIAPALPDEPGTGGGVSGNDGNSTSIHDELPFVPRENMMYFTLVDVVESFAPCLTMACGDFCGEGSSQIVCTSGRGKQAGLRVLRRGFAVLELMTQMMPGTIFRCFTLRASSHDSHDRYIVVCFSEHTKVLRVNEETVAESDDTGLRSDCRTLLAAQVGESSLLQVYADAVRFVPGGNAPSSTEWNPPREAKILSAATNSAQVVVALSTGDVVYFDLGSAMGNELLETDRIVGALPGVAESDAASALTSLQVPLALPAVSPGRAKAFFLAVSDGVSNMVRVYQLDSDKEFRSVSVHMAPAPVDTLALVDFSLVSDADSSSSAPMLCLVVGTRKGALVTLRLDPTSGALSGRRSHFLGPRPVHVQSLMIGGVTTCLALSVRPWMLHKQGSRLALSPLCTESVDSVAAFSSEQNPDGFLGVFGATLRFLTLESLGALSASSMLPDRLPASLMPSDVALGSTFFMSKSKLSCTPRRIAPLFPPTADVTMDRHSGQKRSTASRVLKEGKEGLFVVIESEHRAKFRSPLASGVPATTGADSQRGKRHLTEAGLGEWASQLRLISVKSVDHEGENAGAMVEDDNYPEDSAFSDLFARAGTTLDVVPFVGDDTCALCIAVSSDLRGAPYQETHVVVSVAKRLVAAATSSDAPSLRSSTEPSGELHVFRVNFENRKLERLQVTPMEVPVYSIVAFRDKLLVGVGTSLRLYELGKRQLLRKAECRRAVANQVCAMTVAGGDRIFVGDIQDSVTLVKYYPSPSNSSEYRDHGVSRDAGRLVAIARDGVPRCIVALLTLDYSTICASDKFGNLFVLRLPPELSGITEESAVDISGSLSQDISNRLTTEACIHIGSTVVSLALGTMRGGTGVDSAGVTFDDADAIVYCTIDGAIGNLAPFAVKSDADLAGNLERELRERNLSLVGRSHVSYRSSFYPVKNVVDGDLCELFLALSREEQIAVAERVERDIPDILRKLDEFRANAL